jgi:hypothetical protein
MGATRMRRDGKIEASYLVRTIAGPLVAAIVATGCGEIEQARGIQAGTRAAEMPETRIAAGDIAYVTGDGRELRVVAPDGTGDRLVWRVPEGEYTITGPAWRPDGSEIAFASDHEMAVSFFQRDLYAIRPDGSGFRKLTNPPHHEDLASLPKGTATVTVENLTFDGGPYFVYLMGAPEPQQITLGGGASQRLSFTSVADLGSGVFQPAVVIHGIQRWWDAAAAADVRPGANVDAGQVMISANPIQRFGADGPFWRPDGSRVGFFFGPTCLLQEVPVEPPPGPSFEPRVEPAAFGSICAADWGPDDQLLLVDATSEFVDTGRTLIYRAAPGASRKGEPVAVFDRYVQVTDIRWLPDGSGFVVARQDDLLDEDINLYAFDLASRTLRTLTELEGGFARRFSIGPDGSIAFERVTGGSVHDLVTLPSDIWVMGPEGANARLVVRNAAFPAWNPAR